MTINNNNIQYRYCITIDNNGTTLFLYKNGKFGVEFKKARIFNRICDLKQSKAYNKQKHNIKILILALVNPNIVYYKQYNTLEEK